MGIRDSTCHGHQGYEIIVMVISDSREWPWASETPHSHGHQGYEIIVMGIKD